MVPPTRQHTAWSPDPVARHIIVCWLLADKPDTALGRLWAKLHKDPSFRYFDRLGKLRQYVKNPGLYKDETYTDDNGQEQKLSKEDVERIFCVESYLTWLQNDWGPETKVHMEHDPLVLTDFTREEFEYYYEGLFDPKSPEKVDRHGRLEAWARRHQDWGRKSPTAGTSTAISTDYKVKAQPLKKAIADFPELTDDDDYATRRSECTGCPMVSRPRPTTSRWFA